MRLAPFATLSLMTWLAACGVKNKNSDAGAAANQAANGAFACDFSPGLDHVCVLETFTNITNDDLLRGKASCIDDLKGHVTTTCSPDKVAASCSASLTRGNQTGRIDVSVYTPSASTAAQDTCALFTNGLDKQTPHLVASPG